jgi:signal transduction histidine kinase
MDATPSARLPTGISHRMAPVLGWVTATFVLVSPFVSLVGDCLGIQRGFAILVPVALPAILVVAALLRRFPLTVVSLLLAATVATALVPLPYTTLNSPEELTAAQLGPAAIAICYVAATRSSRIALSALAMVVVTLVGFHAVKAGQQGMDLHRIQVQLKVASAVGVAWLIGHSIRQSRRATADSRRHATEQAITAERLRIARELHDMVAHSIGIIAIQAGVGSRVIETQPAEAREALRAIEATSRETLSGLRRTLVALRRADPDPVPASAPAPGLADLDRLAATTTDAGVRVEVRWGGERRPLPSDIDLSAYRIVQEAVTNVVRHAGTGYCRVLVGYGKDELSVEVTDDGRGLPGGAGDTGFGITGMRERVSLLHGHFSAGPRPEGGFRVAARLPLPEPVAAV